MVEFSTFKPEKYLKTEVEIDEFLTASLKENDPEHIIRTLSIAAAARNKTKLSQEIGMTRPGLYKALSSNQNPSFETIVKLADALGYNLILKKKKKEKRV